jgi:cytochrome c oxidase assembly factor CtaG
MWKLIFAPWHFEPMVIAAIVVAVALYWIGRSTLQRAPAGAFYAGLAAIAVALLSPVDDLADALFSGHMAQHLLLILLAAPLLAISRAGAVLFLALPRQLRMPLSHAASWLPRAWRPVTFWLGFIAIFLFWHLPQAYGWARESEAVHISEHLTLLLSACAFWSVIFASRARAPSFAARSLFCVITAFVTDLPAVIMIFSPVAFYTGDPVAVARWGLTPLEDQQLAGLMMWVPASFLFFGAAIWCFARYLSPQPPSPALRLEVSI